jgi:hypothetical protein
MRIFCYKTVIGFIVLTLANVANADKLIYGFNNVSVTNRLTTAVELDQADFKSYSKTDNLKLRVSDENKVIREDAVLNKDGVWIWDKVLPFSDNLKLVILKNDKPISIEYAADNKSSLTFSVNDASVPMVRGVYNLATVEKPSGEKINLSFELPKELKNCKDKILAVVFNEKNNSLLWQYYGEPKEDLKTGDIDYSGSLQKKIIIDEGSCVK